MGWYYANNDINSTRYYLGTRGKKHLICLGISPGDSSPSYLDQTILNVEQVAFQNGFDSWIIMNVYPKRAADKVEFNGEPNRQIHQSNLEYIKGILEEIREKEGPPVIWAAWGEYIEVKDYFYSCLEDILKLCRQYDCRWLTFGSTANGKHPAHPAEVEPPGEKQNFSIESYIEKIGPVSP